MQLGEKIIHEVEKPLRTSLSPEDADTAGLRSMEASAAKNAKEYEDRFSRVGKYRKALDKASARKSDAAAAKLSEATAALDACRVAWREDAPLLLGRYEQVDRARLEKIQAILITYESAQAEVAKSLGNMADTGLAHVLAFDPASEVTRVSAEQTGLHRSATLSRDPSRTTLTSISSPPPPTSQTSVPPLPAQDVPFPSMVSEAPLDDQDHAENEAFQGGPFSDQGEGSERHERLRASSSFSSNSTSPAFQESIKDQAGPQNGYEDMVHSTIKTVHPSHATSAISREDATGEMDGSEHDAGAWSIVDAPRPSTSNSEFRSGGGEMNPASGAHS
ncbi:hypothetical protein BJ684DRAFT_21990, partial [Piptocephalis cylindrospora]